MSTLVNAKEFRFFNTMPTIMKSPHKAREEFGARFRDLVQNSSKLMELPSDTARAEALGLSKSLYAQWINGQKKGGYEKSSEVCLRLGANVDYLLNDKMPKYLPSNNPQPASGDKPGDLPNAATSTEVSQMNLAQHKSAMSDLLENLSSNTRQEVLQHAAREALRKGEIQRVPDWMMSAEWNAAGKIAQASATSKRKPGKGDQ